jgi:hypothetical protein
MAFQQGKETKEAAEATQTAAEATQTAVERTENHVAENHLLVWIPQLVQVTREAETELTAGDGSRVRSSYARWRSTARQVQVLLRRTHPGHGAIALIDKAITLAPSALDAVRDEAGEPEARTRHLRTAMTDAAEEAETLVTERMAFLRSTDG